MDRIREIENDGGLGAAVMTRESLTLTSLRALAPSPCRLSVTAKAGMAMRDLVATLAMDPLLYFCPGGHEGRADVRYRYFDPPALSCRHRIARRREQRIPEP